MTNRLSRVLLAVLCAGALGAAEQTPDPEVVRGRIDRLEAARLAANRPASMGLLCDVIDLSISYGAPAYDGGDPAACLAFYVASAGKLVHSFGGLKDTPPEVADALKALSDADARQRASTDVSHRAWSMRFAFDQIKLMSGIDDELAKAQIASGEQYFGLDCFEEAEVAYAKAFALVNENLGDQLSSVGADTRVAGILEAQTLLQLGRTAEAAGIMAKAVPLFPEITTSKLDWHQLSRNRAVADQALASAEAAAAAHPDDADLAFLLAVEQRFGGHDDQAARTLATVMKLSPHHAGGRLLSDVDGAAGPAKPAPRPAAPAGKPSDPNDIPF